MQQRNLISHKFTIGYYFFLVIFILLWINFIIRLSSFKDLSFSLISTIAWSIFSLIIAFFLKRTPIVKFDGLTLYYKYGKRDIQVDIENIVELKLTMVEVNSISMWKIKYNDGNNTKSIRAFFNDSNQIFQDFIKSLEERKVKVRKVATSFDI